METEGTALREDNNALYLKEDFSRISKTLNRVQRAWQLLSTLRFFVFITVDLNKFEDFKREVIVSFDNASFQNEVKSQLKITVVLNGSFQIKTSGYYTGIEILQSFAL